MPKNRLFPIIFILFLAAYYPAQAQSAKLAAAWIDRDGLWLWHEGDAAPNKLAASAGSLQPGFSPDGKRLGYFTESVFELTILRLDGSVERRIVLSRLISEVAWLDDQTILFNTRTLRTDEQTLRTAQNDDLWRIDLTNGEVRQVCTDGQGGQFTISPRRDRIALVTPGNYADQSPGTVSTIDRDCQKRTDFMKFPVINTASSTVYYPTVQWEPDGSALRTAIPDPKLIYDGTRLTQLWRLSDKAQNIGAVQADFFGRPTWSADGQWLTFLRRKGVDQLSLILTGGDGKNPQTIAEGKVGAFSASQWLPDVPLFTYVNGKPGEVWLAGSTTAPMRLGTEPAFQVVWTPDSVAYFYTTTPGLAGALRYATRAAMQPQAIAQVNDLRALAAATIP